MNAPNQLSFLPDDYLETKQQRRTNAICLGLFMVVIVAVGAAFMVTERSKKVVQTEWQAVNERFTEAAKPIAQFKKMQDKQRRMDSQAALTASLLEKVPRSNLLAELTNALAPSVSLLDFSMDAKLKKDAPVFASQFDQKKAEMDAKGKSGTAQPRAYDVTMKLTGVADTDVSVAAFINNLSRSPLLKEVNLLVSEQFEQDKHAMRKFQIEMTLRPDADAQQLVIKTPKALSKSVSAVADVKDAK